MKPRRRPSRIPIKQSTHKSIDHPPLRSIRRRRRSFVNCRRSDRANASSLLRTAGLNGPAVGWPSPEQLALNPWLAEHAAQEKQSGHHPHGAQHPGVFNDRQLVVDAVPTGDTRPALPSQQARRPSHRDRNSGGERGRRAGRVVNAAMHGQPVRTTEEVYAERMGTCQTCDAFNPVKFRCKDCKCFLPVKARLATEAGKCPRKKWKR